MQLFPPAPEPAAFAGGEGLLFWYGAEHVARAENSRRYRIDNRLAQLPAAQSYVGRRLADAVLAGIRLVLCVRPFVDGVMRREIERLRARGLAVWADYDDLLFQGRPADFPGAGRIWQHFRWKRRLPVYAQGLALFDGFTCSTPPIAEALAALRPGVPVHLVENVPSARWIEQGWADYGPLAWKPGAPRVLRYLPGSPSHDEDFRVVEDTLAGLLHEVPELELEVVGYLNFHLKRFPPARVRHRPKVPYARLPEVLLPTWLNLVPKAPTPYSRARSNIKELEALAFDVPSVVGGASEFDAAIRGGLERGR